MRSFASWLMLGLLASACGGAKSQMLADAPGGGDDSQGDASPSPLVKATALTTLGDGLPDLTAKILFQDASGGVVLDDRVDSAGHQQANLPMGGSVSAIRIVSDTPTTLSVAITTITGVKPGDDLTFGVKPPGTITNQGEQTSMTATFAGVPAAGSYTFYTACGTSSAAADATTVTLNFRDSCHGDTFDLLAIASGGTLTAPMSLEWTNIPYVSGGSFTIPGGFAAMATWTVNMTNVPDPVSSLTVTRSSLIDNAVVAAQSSATVDPPAGAFMTTVPFTAGFGTRSQVVISMARPDATVSQTFAVRTSTLAPSVSVDLGKQQLPWLKDLALKPDGGAWTTVVPGDQPDGMVTFWGGSWSARTQTVTVAWRVVHPVAPAGMTLPRLPAAYAAYDPGQQTVAVVPGTLQLNIVDYDTVAGYDEFRQMPETLIGSLANLGAFVGMPFQRRSVVGLARSSVAGDERVLPALPE